MQGKKKKVLVIQHMLLPFHHFFHRGDEKSYPTLNPKAMKSIEHDKLRWNHGVLKVSKGNPESLWLEVKAPKLA